MNFKESAELFKLSKEIAINSRNRVKIFKEQDLETQISVLASQTRPTKKDIVTSIPEEMLTARNNIPTTSE